MEVPQHNIQINDQDKQPSQVYNEFMVDLIIKNIQSSEKKMDDSKLSFYKKMAYLELNQSHNHSQALFQ